MAAAKKPAGKGLVEKRMRLLRCLDAHIRYLDVAGGLSAWTPPVREPYPPRQLPSFHQRHTPAYLYPRERPELKYPAPGPEALSEEEIKAWVADDPFVRGGLSAKTQRAMAFIVTFAPASLRGLGGK